MAGKVVILSQKISFQWNPLKQKKKVEKIASWENLTTKKMRTGSNLYYGGFSSWDLKKNPIYKPLKEVKNIKWKIACVETSSTTELRSGQSFYNCGCGSWDLTKTILSMKPLKEVEKIIIIKLRL